VPGRRESGTSGDAVAVLTIRRGGPSAGHTFIVARDAVTVLGRAPGCEIVLAHVTVSRRHAEVRPTPVGFELVDTGSLNGSYLNGEPVDRAPLSDGDEMQLGIFRLSSDVAKKCRTEGTL
jgi:pSer/pThr/pTyr-binding forkhead associated (FHA) protein